MLFKEQSAGKQEKEQEKAERNLWLGNDRLTEIILLQFLLFQAVIDISSHLPKMTVSNLYPEEPEMCSCI